MNWYNFLKFNQSLVIDNPSDLKFDNIPPNITSPYDNSGDDDSWWDQSDIFAFTSVFIDFFNKNLNKNELNQLFNIIKTNLLDKYLKLNFKLPLGISYFNIDKNNLAININGFIQLFHFSIPFNDNIFSSYINSTILHQYKDKLWNYVLKNKPTLEIINKKKLHENNWFFNPNIQEALEDALNKYVINNSLDEFILAYWKDIDLKKYYNLIIEKVNNFFNQMNDEDKLYLLTDSLILYNIRKDNKLMDLNENEFEKMIDNHWNESERIVKQHNLKFDLDNIVIDYAKKYLIPKRKPYSNLMLSWTDNHENPRILAANLANIFKVSIRIIKGDKNG